MKKYEYKILADDWNRVNINEKTLNELGKKGYKAVLSFIPTYMGRDENTEKEAAILLMKELN